MHPLLNVFHLQATIIAAQPLFQIGAACKVHMQVRHLLSTRKTRINPCFKTLLHALYRGQLREFQHQMPH